MWKQRRKVPFRPKSPPGKGKGKGGRYRGVPVTPLFLTSFLQGLRHPLHLFPAGHLHSCTSRIFGICSEFLPIHPLGVPPTLAASLSLSISALEVTLDHLEQLLLFPWERLFLWVCIPFLPSSTAGGKHRNLHNFLFDSLAAIVELQFPPQCWTRRHPRPGKAGYTSDADDQRNKMDPDWKGKGGKGEGKRGGCQGVGLKGGGGGQEESRSPIPPPPYHSLDLRRERLLSYLNPTTGYNHLLQLTSGYSEYHFLSCIWPTGE